MTVPPPPSSASLAPAEALPYDEPFAPFEADPPITHADGALPPEPPEATPTRGGSGNRRFRFLPRSLTSKLVAGVVSLVLIIVCATGTCTYFALKSELQNRLDQQLQQTAGPNVPISVRAISSSPPSSQFQSSEGPTSVVLLNNGDVLGYLPEANGLALDSVERTRLAKETGGGSITVTSTTGQQVRVTVRHGTIGPFSDQLAGAVVIGLPLNEEQRTVRQLVRLEFLIGLGALLVALFATTYGVQFSLRRLRRVTQTAQDVAAELSPDGAGLDRRVPVVEEGTEVGQLAESMNTLLSAVETQFAARVESENRMRQFLADASHELRTPLTSIRGYAELARMQRAAGSADEDNLDRIESEGTRMSRLVEDLLMLARGDQDSIPRIELVDVADLVDDAVMGARAANPNRSIVVDPVPSYNVVGDPDQLVRVIRNLLTNAVVHTPQDSPIRVRAFIDGPGIATQVIDGGPGLPPEEASHVFERFWRADKARTRARGGSGLGLSIVASIVQAHQGATHFESTVEGGSTVTVWLPGVTA